jgi:hypothetical protein
MNTTRNNLLDIFKTTVAIGGPSVEEAYTPPGKRLLDAILQNRFKEVQALLEDGADPNVSLAIISSRFIFTDQESQNKALSIDKVFLWKKIFGEAPTPVHVAVILIYHYSTRHKLLQRRDLDKALQILTLLLQHGGDVSMASNNIFLRKAPAVTQTNPLDLALGVQRMTLWMHLETPEAAMIQAVDIMRREHNHNHNHHHNNNNNNNNNDESSTISDRSSSNHTTNTASSSMTTQRKNRIPFALVSLPLLDKLQAVLFSTHSFKDPSHPDNNSDISFVTSDGSRIPSSVKSITSRIPNGATNGTILEEGEKKQDGEQEEATDGRMHP